MSQRYVLTTVAQRHFIEIGDFVSQESIEAAEKVYDALEEAFERLADMPGIGPRKRWGWQLGTSGSAVPPPS